MTEAGSAWRCTVCGYIHRGAEAPDECPVCGAPKDAFEPYEEPAPRPGAGGQERPRAKKWRCLVCGYVHSGSEPPEPCPVCGAQPDRFEPLGGEVQRAWEEARSKKVVIVGAGIAGLAAAEAVRQALPSAQITLVGRESHLPYYRLNLTRYVAGEIGREDLPIHPQDWYDKQNIRLRLGAEASAVDLDARRVTCSGGSSPTVLPYNKLLLAAGAHAFVPPFPGADRPGVTTLRTVDDAQRIVDSCRSGTQCVCIGGGVLGVETAAGLARRGADVTLLEGHAWLMPRQLDQTAAELLAERIAGLGVTLRTNARTQEILGDPEARAVQLEDGQRIAAELVVIATGIRSNTHLARAAGLEVHRAVVVNNSLATSHPDVFAAGDAAEHRGVTYGLWAPAQYQGNIAGMNLAGQGVEFGGIPRATTLKVVGLDVFSVGQFALDDASFGAVRQRADGRYRLFVHRDGRLVGAILAGDTHMAATVEKAVNDSVDVSALLGKQATADQMLEFLGQRSD